MVCSWYPLSYGYVRHVLHEVKFPFNDHSYIFSWGAGDFNLTHSHVTNNWVDGVNITYGGGNRNVSWSKIESNVGYGMALWLNETTG